MLEAGQTPVLALLGKENEITERAGFGDMQRWMLWAVLKPLTLIA